MECNMNLEGAPETRTDVPAVRITRARAKMLDASSRILRTSRPSFKQEQKSGILANAKRAALNENKVFADGVAGLQHKRRAVLKDVTNILCDNVHVNHVRALKNQEPCLCRNQQIIYSKKILASSTSNVSIDRYPRILKSIKLILSPSACCMGCFLAGQNSKHTRKGPAGKDKNLLLDGSVEVLMLQEDVKVELANELSKIRVGKSLKITDPDPSKWIKEGAVMQCLSSSLVNVGGSHPKVESAEIPNERIGTLEEDMDCEKLEGPNCSSIADIDSKLKDPQGCIPYATDIYKNVRILELDQRPSINYMEKVQQDITPNMRGILIDWLVEVSEEYKLAADTLYLTVNLIDRFLTQHPIEKQRLQLLGVTCMLIASKYEEICAPRVEEFCFITDNTYTKQEVVKMEGQVLNLLHFQFSVPTIKPFLRRFIQAAQVSHRESSIELEFLANYLAELTLVEYSFLKFLPSLLAASSVFLARWTLSPLDHPWNPTLEHYTNYKASELKATVLALEDLQRNTSGCSLNAIREKYRQRKFKCVATLTPEDPVSSLFKD